MQRCTTSVTELGSELFREEYVARTLPQRVKDNPSPIYICILTGCLCYGGYKLDSNKWGYQTPLVLNTALWFLIAHVSYDLTHWTTAKQIGSTWRYEKNIVRPTMKCETTLGRDQLQIEEHLLSNSEVTCALATKENASRALCRLLFPDYNNAKRSKEGWERAVANFNRHDWDNCWRNERGDLAENGEQQTLIVLEGDISLPFPKEDHFCAIPTSLLPQEGMSRTLYFLWETEGVATKSGCQLTLRRRPTEAGDLVLTAPVDIKKLGDLTL
jgi:hypothetical protein